MQILPLSIIVKECLMMQVHSIYFWKMHSLLIAQTDNSLEFGIEYTVLSHHNTFSTQMEKK